MSLFEFTFGLKAIILGLALTHIVVGLNRLWQARERVKWAIQPLLAVGLVLTSILLFWTQSWARQEDSTTVGAIVFDVLVSLSIFAAAAAVLPDEAPRAGSGGEVTDLGAYFERQRRSFFFVYALPIFAVGIARPLVETAQGAPLELGNWPNLVIVALIGVCAFVRNRWVNLVVLTFLLLGMLAIITQYRLTGG